MICLQYVFITSLHKFWRALIISCENIPLETRAWSDPLSSWIILSGDWRRSDRGRSDNRWGHPRPRGHCGPIRGRYGGRWPIRGQYCIITALDRTNCFSYSVINRYSKHKQWQQFLWNILGKWNNVARSTGKNIYFLLILDLLWIILTALHHLSVELNYKIYLLLF